MQFNLQWKISRFFLTVNRPIALYFFVFFRFFVVFLDTINLPCTVIDGEFWFWSSDWETFLSVMSLPAKDEKCSVSNALWQIWCWKQKNELCTAWTYDKVSAWVGNLKQRVPITSKSSHLMGKTLKYKRNCQIQWAPDSTVKKFSGCQAPLAAMLTQASKVIDKKEPKAQYFYTFKAL